MTTTGHTISSNIKAMITGYEALDDPETHGESAVQSK